MPATAGLHIAVVSFPGLTAAVGIAVAGRMELCEEAQRRDVEGRFEMSKDELIAALRRED